MLNPRPRIFFLIGPTLGNRHPSGVQRVVVETARSLAESADLQLVRYDADQGGLRPLGVRELDDLFGAGDWPPGMAVDPQARRLGVPFREGREPGDDAWLLIGDVPWPPPGSTEGMARAISQCRAWGVRIAAIFYDLIPIRNPDYAAFATLHVEYVAHLARTDLVLAISTFSANDLSDLWTKQGVEEPPVIVPVLLPDGGFGSGSKGAVPHGDGPVALIGTVEPRKRQVEFLRAYAAARKRSNRAASTEVILCGSLHGDVADEIERFTARFPWARHLNYAPEARVAQAFAEAPFTVFASADEGYGLPIAESLAAGVPCLCADFGAMAEVASGGGCLTVNVRDPRVLEQAIVDLFEQPDLLPRLRGEISRRRLSGWGDYARRLLDAFAEWTPPPETGGLVLKIGDGPLDISTLRHADILCFGTAADRDRLVVGATDLGPDLLPSRLAIGPDDAALLLADLSAARALRGRVARTERAFLQARRADPRRSAATPLRLRLLISTHNRRDFVVNNVAWLLKEVLPPFGGGVDLVVFDGASRDGTTEALRAINDPRLSVIDAVDAGMLGGWREAAKLSDAEYVWVIGDDDFVRPEGLRAILGQLQANPGLPFGFVNFGVYHRAAWSPTDRVADFLREATPMASRPSPTGVLPVARVAEQHDNLFTAIYAIVWRSDVLATAYDHSFSGPPFANLIEAIPCTEAILRLYGDCQGFWISDPALAGNAHNSWSRHRPRWHGVVMPQALALARDVGVDGATLQEWADVQFKLYVEALDIARARKIDPELTSEMLEPSKIVFRQDPAGEAWV